MRTRIIGCAGFLILALVMQANLLGQAITGTLQGSVLDSYRSRGAECECYAHE